MKRTPLNRNKGLPFKSPKQKKRDADWKHAKRLRAEHAEYRCEAGITNVCDGYGRHGHHVVRDRTLNTFHNCRWLCFACHRFIHDHPAWSYAMGYLDRSASARGTQLVPRRVSAPRASTTPSGGPFDWEEC